VTKHYKAGGGDLEIGGVYADHGWYGLRHIATFAKREEAFKYAKGHVTMNLPMVIHYKECDITITMNA